MGTIIRREQMQTPSRYSFSDLERRAGTIIAEARAEAEQIRAAAREEAAQMRQTAREQGHEEGLAVGRTDGEAQLREELHSELREQTRESFERLQTALVTLVQQLDMERHRLLADAESGLVRLSLAIAERVCKNFAADGSEAARGNVQRLLESVHHDGDVELYVHPNDLAAIERDLPALKQRIDGLQHVHLRADDGLTQGGCVVRTPTGHADATLETQLRRIALSLLGEEDADA